MNIFLSEDLFLHQYNMFKTFLDYKNNLPLLMHGQKHTYTQNILIILMN